MRKYPAKATSQFIYEQKEVLGIFNACLYSRYEVRFLTELLTDSYRPSDTVEINTTTNR